MADIPIASLLKRGEIKILFVEDDVFLRKLLTARLRDAGYTVIEASGGQEGLALARSQNPHLMLSDLILPPPGDGYELLKQLAADPILGGIPVVILSNMGSLEDAERTRELGAKDFLIKAHFTPQEIVERIRHVLEASYLRR